MDKALAVKIYERAGNEPACWRSCAQDLLAAASVLRQRREKCPPDVTDDLVGSQWRIHPPELMLRGMAVECLLKALWVKRGNRIVKDGEYVGVPGAGSHNLVQVAGVLQLRLSRPEVDLLRRLTEFIEYGGRYPVPRNAQDLRPIRRPGGGKAPGTGWFTPGDQLLFDNVIRRLEKALDAV